MHPTVEFLNTLSQVRKGYKFHLYNEGGYAYFDAIPYEVKTDKPTCNLTTLLRAIYNMGKRTTGELPTLTLIKK